MFAHIFNTSGFGPVTVVGIGILVLGLFVVLKKGLSFLPGDGGTDVTGGAISKGKPTGAGIVLIIALDIIVLLFTKIHPELFIYLLLISAEMVTGFLDDKATVEWGRKKKGLFDLAVCVIFAITYLAFNPHTIIITVTGANVHVPVVLFAILIIALCWFSINVTNCADGVDGLTGTLSIVTLLPMLLIMRAENLDPAFRNTIMLLIVCLLIYLCFNANPSKLMMGDAGSRSIGLFIAIAAVKSHHPILYLLLALVLLADGGLGLIKITIIKATKNPDFWSRIRTPIHDHCRKKLGWSDTQVVIRFAAVQAVLAFGVICYMM